MLSYLKDGRSNMILNTYIRQNVIKTVYRPLFFMKYFLSSQAIEIMAYLFL